MIYEVQSDSVPTSYYTINFFSVNKRLLFPVLYFTMIFQLGDIVIQILSDILKEFAGYDDFVGHIGGDDFVMICKGYPPTEVIQSLRKKFEEQSHRLYNEADQKNGYITAPNRHGVIENFPLVSVTIVSLSNGNAPFRDYEDVSSTLSHYKKQAKAALH